MNTLTTQQSQLVVDKVYGVNNNVSTRFNIRYWFYTSEQTRYKIKSIENQPYWFISYFIRFSRHFSDITSKPSYLVGSLIPGNNVTITSGSDTLKIEISGGGGGTISGSSQVDHDTTTNFGKLRTLFTIANYNCRYSNNW